MARPVSQPPDRPPWRHANPEAELLDFHLSMLLDDTRMDAYERAISRLVQPGDVVLDIGAGTGVLSFLACAAGARRVYAIEGGPVIEIARELSATNRFSDRVVFVNEWSTDVDLPERADVLITETIGNAAFDEGIIAWTKDARRRLLRSEARVVPNRIRMWVAAVDTWDDHAQLSDWSASSLPFDFAVVRRRAERTLWFAEFRANQLLTQSTCAADIDLSSAGPSVVAASGVLRVVRDGTLHGLACWFDAELVDGVTLTNSPPTEAPSWSQGFLPIAEPRAVRAGEELEWRVEVSADSEHWDWSIEP